MEGAFKTAYNVLPLLSRNELKQLQSRISDLLSENEDISANLLHPRSDTDWEMEFDAAISEFDTGNGYEADQMCQSIRKRFGWAKV